MVAPGRLDERVPERGFSGPDALLDTFLDWVAEQGLALYPHQQDAILEIVAGRHVVLDAPTGSGKSLVAVALHFKTFAETGRAWYTAPVKALVSQKFFELCAVFGAENVGMATGDGAVNRDAPILCCTAEILANLALREGSDAPVTSVVMDEFHYYGDRDRGMAWQIPLLTLNRATFLLMSGTLGDTTAIREDLALRTGREVAEIRGVHRPVPLEFSYSMKPIHDALSELVRGNKAPVYVVHFTQRAATEQAQALTSVELCTKEEKAAIADAVRGFGFHSPFGPTVRRYVLHGVGLHHAGLLPRYRLLVERLAQQGLLKVICGTDTLGVGINVPIRTVLFTQLCKFDGEKVVILPVRDFQQIAGRAGRAGYDSVGYVVVQAPAHVIENAKVLVTDPKRRKKVVKAQAPTFGYKHWDEDTFRQLVARPPETLESRFDVGHGTLLSLMQHAADTTGDARAGVGALHDLVDRSHLPPKSRAKMHTRTDELLENLLRVGVVEPRGDGLVVDPTLQHDFSLHHSLSLLLLDALATLDPNEATHALDVITWVEAILEHPRPVLQRQVERARGVLVAELKAAGVPYEERMEALDEVDWPKPNGERIYAWFNAYAERHPWVAAEAIRPKSVLREMAETWASFAQYVNDLGLQRSEGVLLRYLMDAYKALAQNVPPEHHTPQLLDHVAYLRTMLARVDASLLTEWERLVQGQEGGTEVVSVDISADRKRFVARVRAELHGLVRALVASDWDEAARSVAPSDGWDAAAFRDALAPFVEEYGAVGFDARTRLAEHTAITAVGPHQWTVRQRLLPRTRLEVDQHEWAGPDDGPDEGTWAIEGRIDLRRDTDPVGPIVEIAAIGG
jgi:hypothetical protein